MKLHRVGLLLLSCTCLLPCTLTGAPVRADVRREAEALLNWKASLAGADESLRSWSSANSSSLCSWEYIGCNLAGHMTDLVLDSVSLNGTLDRFDFSAFPQLQVLIMSQNGLYGIIPPGIGNLTRLVALSIGENLDLRGEIPRSIGQLNHLVALQLSYLGLDGILPEEEIGNLTSLEVLMIRSVPLTGSIPLTVGVLVQLHTLWLEKNNLTGSIPLGIGNMTELQNLYIVDNNLEGMLPGTVSHLTKLQKLDLSGNQLGGQIFPHLGNSSGLFLINIAGNNFFGLFPPSICIGRSLRYVIAPYNGFTGIHHETFQNCTTLETVDFKANNIVADLSGYFGDHLKALAVMDFRQNQLYGTLLTDQGEVFLCNYTSLFAVDLSNNALHGGLSKCFWGMPSLILIDLSFNSFSGVIPFSMKSECNLKYLHLANNHLEGTFPLGLKKCTYLTTLDLGGNNFSGKIPSWISKSLPGLKFLRLSSNMFEGIIPVQILHFRNLQLLDLSKNKLAGSIPEDFTNFTGMAQAHEYEITDDMFYMHAEQIQIVWKYVGYVYTINIASIAGIDLSCNFLSQEIPGGLTTVLGLRYLNLSGNHLSGCIPEDIGNLVLLESLNFSRNQLSGKIPPSIAALKGMSALNLSSNELSGRIPTGSQLQTLIDPSIYSNNPGLCGFPLNECVNSSTSTQSKTRQAEDREALWLYCFVTAGFIFGFWLYWGMFLFNSVTWRCAFYQYVDNMQGTATKNMYSCMSCFQGNGNE